VTGALHRDAYRRPDAHDLLERLLTSGAAGNPSIRADATGDPNSGARPRAVRHTVRYQPPTEHPRTRPVYPIGTLVQRRLIAAEV
jgi:hypothetical protein